MFTVTNTPDATVAHTGSPIDYNGIPRLIEFLSTGSAQRFPLIVGINGRVLSFANSGEVTAFVACYEFARPLCEDEIDTQRNQAREEEAEFHNAINN